MEGDVLDVAKRRVRQAPGQSKIINLQLGHSEGVGLNHYTDLEQVVRSFKWT